MRPSIAWSLLALLSIAWACNEGDATSSPELAAAADVPETSRSPESEPAPVPQKVSEKNRAPVLAATASSDAADELAGLGDHAWSSEPNRVLFSEYATAIDEDWRRWSEQVGSPMLSFADQQMPTSSGKTVFYPFSGPDFPTVHRIFPDADRYVLVAMQKGGPPPEPEALSPEDLQAMLGVYREVFANYTRKGFFITDEMNAAFTPEHPVKGISGLLMAFAAREGYLVESVQPIWISPEGAVELDPGHRARLRTWDSVRLQLRRRSDGKPVQLDYLRLNLADRHVDRREHAMKWVEHIASELVFVKAASHLMQQSNFRYIRRVLLEKAEAIVQDESGVGYSELTRRHEVTLFGTFKRVNKLFREGPQVPLAEAYRDRDDVRELPFRIGYLKAAGSCLQLAVPKDSPVEG
jgi:hypothetical protein